MKKIFLTLIFVLIASCSGGDGAIKNPRILSHAFLADMYHDDYYPEQLVDKGKAILLALCEQLEKADASTPAEVYTLTHAATIRFNELNYEFENQDSEIETVAREAIAADIEFILLAYGYELDIEEAIAPRDW